MTLVLGIFLVIAYLFGSLSSAIIVCRLLELPDPRTQGSQNPGATNVLRIGGKQAAFITLLGDVIKGALPVLFAHMAGITDFPLGLVGVFAVLGHLFPVFFKFKGGKGVATACGVLIALSWMAGLVAIASWLLLAFIFRYSSLASIITAVLSSLYVAIFSVHFGYVLPVFIISIILIYTHMPNIQRLRAGTESKIKF